MNVAQLKHKAYLRLADVHGTFPRSNERGSIEAASFVHKSSGLAEGVSTFE